MIVVGVDGSPGSDAALRWALDEARLRGSKLQVVHAYEPPSAFITEAGLGVGGVPSPPVSADAEGRLREAAEAAARDVIEQALQRAAGETAPTEIEVTPAQGSAARTLLEAAEGAELLVVGSRGRGGFLGLLLGSVSQQCAQHPPCPVVILPSDEASDDLQGAGAGTPAA